MTHFPESGLFLEEPTISPDGRWLVYNKWRRCVALDADDRARSAEMIRMSLTPGTRLGPYEVVAALGAGGMGEVYKARDTRLDRTVAIKVLPSALAGDSQFRERFEREARAISHSRIRTSARSTTSATTRARISRHGVPRGRDARGSARAQGPLPRRPRPWRSRSRLPTRLRRPPRGHRPSRPETGQFLLTAARSCSISASRRRRRPHHGRQRVDLRRLRRALTGTARSSARFNTWRPSKSKAPRLTPRLISSRSVRPARDADGSEGVRGQDARESHSGDSRAGAAAGHHAATTRAGARRCDCPKVSGKEGGRSVAERG